MMSVIVKGFGCRPLEGRRRVFGGRRPKALILGDESFANGAMANNGTARASNFKLSLLPVTRGNRATLTQDKV
jgi:hypothetical protein